MRCCKQACVALLVAAACATEDEPPTVPAAPPISMEEMGPEAVRIAKETYPTLFDVQVKAIQPTCSPNPGVCHNSNNYPDLRTIGNLVALVSAPCNVEIPDPMLGWDSCERRADVLTAGDFRSDVGWVQKIGPGTWRMGLREAPPSTGARLFTVVADDGHLVLNPPQDWMVQIDLVEGQAEADVTVRPQQAFLTDFVDSVIATIVGGDPNRNGTYGADDDAVGPGLMFWPGQTAKSYLWGRITGEAPGSRMPLANDPLTNDAYVAIACWIEGLEMGKPVSISDVIDYEACEYAKDPPDVAVEF